MACCRLLTPHHNVLCQGRSLTSPMLSHLSSYMHLWPSWWPWVTSKPPGGIFPVSLTSELPSSGTATLQPVRTLLVPPAAAKPEETGRNDPRAKATQGELQLALFSCSSSRKRQLELSWKVCALSTLHQRVFAVTNLLSWGRKVFPAHVNREPNYCPLTLGRRYEINWSGAPLLLKVKNNVMYNVKDKVEHWRLVTHTQYKFKCRNRAIVEQIAAKRRAW